MAVTLKDVARRAKVSVQTVSNVMNGRSEHVGSRTRLQVLQAVEELKYRPNLAARHLRNAPVGVLAVAIPDITNAYFTDIAAALIEAASARGYTVLVDNTFADRAQETMVANGLRPHLIDGIILDPQTLRTEDLEQKTDGIPTVFLGERVPSLVHDHVAIDNVAAAYEATAHLIGLGRRRIASMGLEELTASGAPFLRLQGYGKALEEAGMPLEQSLIAFSTSENTWHKGRREGATAMKQFLALPELPDAVFCYNDLMAVGAMHVATKAGIRIPDHIAFIGIDNLEEGLYANPSLSTIAPDKIGLARIAVEMLLGRIDGSRTGPPELVIPSHTLIARASTLGPASHTSAVLAPPDQRGNPK